MTATVAPTTEPSARTAPIPWLSLAWVVWRRYRTTVQATAVVLGAIGAYLLVTGSQIRSAWQTVQACAPQDSSTCRFAWINFQDKHSTPGLVSAVLIFLPWLIGAFVGAPLLGREFESGTFRYAWTQGAGRIRWVVAMVVGGAVTVTVLCGALGALVIWHDHPLWDADTMSRFEGATFPSTGIAVIGWGLLAYAVGVLAGYLWRRVVPALVTTVAVMFGLGYLLSKLRMHYLTPLRTSSLDPPTGSSTVSQWWEKGGVRVGPTELNTALQSAGIQQIQTGGGGKTTVAAPGQVGGTDPIDYLLHHGFTQWTSYQPASRYWLFQWIEFGWLTALALALLTASIILLRRRAA